MKRSARKAKRAPNQPPHPVHRPRAPPSRTPARALAPLADALRAARRFNARFSTTDAMRKIIPSRPTRSRAPRRVRCPRTRAHRAQNNTFARLRARERTPRPGAWVWRRRMHRKRCQRLKNFIKKTTHRGALIRAALRDGRRRGRDDARGRHVTVWAVDRAPAMVRIEVDRGTAVAAVRAVGVRVSGAWERAWGFIDVDDENEDVWRSETTERGVF